MEFWDRNWKSHQVSEKGAICCNIDRGKGKSYVDFDRMENRLETGDLVLLASKVNLSFQFFGGMECNHKFKKN